MLDFLQKRKINAKTRAENKQEKTKTKKKQKKKRNARNRAETSQQNARNNAKTMNARKSLDRIYFAFMQKKCGRPMTDACITGL